MRLILRTACLSFLCLFFFVNIYGQTTKKTFQTFYPDKTTQFIKIVSGGDSVQTITTWSGDFIWIGVEAEGINIDSVNDYKAKCNEQDEIVIIELNRGKPSIIIKGEEIRVDVTYQIFIPEGLTIVGE